MQAHPNAKRIARLTTECNVQADTAVLLALGCVWLLLWLCLPR